MNRAAFALICALGLTAAPPAGAWVPSRTNKGQPVAWPGSCAWLQPASSGSQDMPIDTVVQVVAKSIANWQTVTLDTGCSYLQIHQDDPADLEARYDHVNTVKFRGDKWCRPAEKDTPEACYSCAAAAITTVFYDNGAKIIDADIELNELDFTFVWLPSNVPPRGQTVMDSCYIAADPLTIVADLENTLTHEIGHFQGLDHTCWDHVSDQPCDSGTACTAGHTCSQRVGPPAQPNMAWAACTGTGCTCQPVDGAGQPVPDCADLSDPITVPTAQAMAIADATMYNFAPPRELRKRSPEADDIAGICATYPAASDPSSCMKPEAAGTCTCRLGRRAPPPLLALLLVTALSAIRIRARRG